MLNLFSNFNEENQTNPKNNNIPNFVLNDLHEFKTLLNKDKPLYVDTETES